jgi:hypothetical protein
LLALASPATATAEDPGKVDSYAPTGTIDVAKTATATASSSEAQWPPSKLIDGNTGTSAVNVWVAADTSADAGGWVDLALKESSTIHRVVIFPRGDAGFYGVYYPIDYTVTLLDPSGAAVWQKQITHADSAGAVIAAPDVIDLGTAVSASQVRVDVAKRQSLGVLQFSEIAVFADGTDSGSGSDPGTGSGTGTDPISQYQPDGTTNLAGDAQVAASSSYEMPGETWSTAFAVNGLSGTADGWSTDPYAKVTDPDTDATLTLDLRCSSGLSRVVVFPRQKDFPKDYSIEVSSDASTWTTIGQTTGNATDLSTPQSFDLSAGSSARYVRLHVTTRNGPDGGDGYLVQISEIAVFGAAGDCANQVKPALLLEPGASDNTWFEHIGSGDAHYTVSSSDTSVATVAADGTVTAHAAGDAVVTLTSADTTLTVPVTVENHIKRIGENFEITAFWPPTVDHVDDEQYANLAAAGIDVVQNAQIDTGTPDQNLKMADLAYKNGMQIVVQDNTVSPGSMTADEAAAWAKRYTDVPGVGGFFLVDEPADATAYAQTFNEIRDVAPSYYPHLNFLPYNALGSAATASTVMQSWLDATGPHTISEPDYLMYDLYPFGAASTAYQDMFTNLDTVRELGLKNTVKTATYLQSIGIPGALRRPDADEIRYEANMALAYGYKQLSYFTWWTPTNRGQEFTDGIMTPDGQKTDLYEPVQQLNSEIHALGPTLMNLDAKEVYLSGPDTYGQATVPSDYFVQPQSKGDAVISHMVDRNTGDDYLFVVNNSFDHDQDVKLTIADSVTAVREVSRTNGTLGDPIALTPATADGDSLTGRSLDAVGAAQGSELTGHLDPSEGVLYKLVRNSDNTGGSGDGDGTGTSTGSGLGQGHGGGHAPAGADKSADGLADTGEDVSWGAIAASVLFVAAGLVLTFYRRRTRHSR